MERKINLTLDDELNTKVEQYQKDAEKFEGRRITKAQALQEVAKGKTINNGNFNKTDEDELKK